MKVEAFMSKPVVTLRVDDSMLDANRLIKERRIKHLPVLDKNDKLVGIVTDRDLKRASASDATTLEIHELLYLLDRLRIKDVMSRNPTTVAPDTSASQAAKLMCDKGFGCLPVVDGGKVVGIVTTNDMLRLLARQE